jgi:hypothetical protein
MSQLPKIEAAKDPLFGLKYIAYLRTTLPKDSDSLDNDTIVSFAKWQVCKSRNILWNDPIWESYTQQEILIEFFAIRFDEDEKLRTAFEAGLVSASKSDMDWLLQDELKEKDSKISSVTNESSPENPEEFEDTF